MMMRMPNPNVIFNKISNQLYITPSECTMDRIRNIMVVFGKESCNNWFNATVKISKMNLTQNQSPKYQKKGQRKKLCR